ncbi:MAG TPA: dienelactone hydrolase family protein [Gammaproteobacteria bacterium]|jgi:pimeloyl-ACP methyl ester carboxylesterase
MSESGTELEIPVHHASLRGELILPADARGIVIFVHGSGSSRLSPRNRQVASFFRAQQLGTLLFDLLTSAEERVDAYSREYRFDIPLLAARLAAVTAWLPEHGGGRLALGYFGASTGAAAALVAAARAPEAIRAVVSRGGRPDLAGDALERVRAPTLLIVGGDDPQVLALNEQARARLQCESELVVVPGATHLFEEPGALEQVAEHAAQWFLRHMQELRPQSNRRQV